MARQLKVCIREVDTAARIGGDEFAVILNDVAIRTGVERTAGMILESFKHPIIIDNALVSVGSSIGIAIFPNDGDDPTTLLANADTAMYAAKRKGKGAFCFFSEIKRELV
ncbi:hypothetical protein CCP3SC15_4380002 [Gammaproteobacteria bacterium]